MTRARSLLIPTSALAATLCVAACGGSSSNAPITHVPTKSTASPSNSGSSGSGNSGDSGSSGAANSGSTGSSTTGGGYTSAFVNAFIKGCDGSGGNKAYCTCVIDYIEKNVPYNEVVSSQGEISNGEKPSWYSSAIQGCLSKA